MESPDPRYGQRCAELQSACNHLEGSVGETDALGLLPGRSMGLIQCGGTPWLSRSLLVLPASSDRTTHFRQAKVFLFSFEKAGIRDDRPNNDIIAARIYFQLRPEDFILFFKVLFINLGSFASRCVLPDLIVMLYRSCLAFVVLLSGKTLSFVPRPFR